MTAPFNPTELARKAALIILDKRDTFCAVPGKAYYGANEAAEDVLVAFRDLIAQSGAVEALERTEEFLDECEVAEDRSNLDGDSAEVVLQQINDGAEAGLPAVKAALLNLRSITEAERGGAK
jgi:hypothetical protein